MSKISLFLTVPAIVGMGALAVWNVSLQAELDDLRAESRATAEKVDEAPARSAEPAAFPAVTERAMTRIKVLESRLEQVEQRAAPVARAAPAATAAEGDPETADGEVAAALSGPEAEFKAKVYAAMDEREAQRRRERRERESQRMAERMLRGVEVTDAQAAQVAAALLDHATQRDALRSQEDVAPDVRRTRFQELTDARNATLTGILGEETFAQVQQRFERRDDGRRRGNRRPGGNRQRGGDQ